MTSPRITNPEHNPTPSGDKIDAHITGDSGVGRGNHARAHNMSSHTDRHKGTDLASATTLTFTTDGDYFHLTGTTKITGISARPAGDRVLLRIISAGLTIEHLTGTLNMRGKINIVSESDTIVEFVSEGLNGAGNPEWTEIRRAGAVDGTNQAYEVPAITGVAPPAPTTVVTGGVVAAGVFALTITGVEAPATANTPVGGTVAAGVFTLAITGVAPPAPTVTPVVT